MINLFIEICGKLKGENHRIYQLLVSRTEFKENTPDSLTEGHMKSNIGFEP